MWHTTIFTLAVAPCLYPVEIKWGKVEEGLSRYCRCIAITTIAEALDLRTVHNVTTEAKVFEGVVNHVINGIHVFVRTSERNIRTIIGAHGTGSNVVQWKSLFQTD